MKTTDIKAMKELDKTDLKILKLLQQNARIPMTELAEKVGLSTTPVTERVRRLERDNLITGYHAPSESSCFRSKPLGLCRAKTAFQIRQYF